MTDAKLKYWGEEWLLTDDMINCSECHAAQFLVNKDDDFVHGPTCPRKGPGQRPYWDLNDMLKKSMGTWKP